MEDDSGATRKLEIPSGAVDQEQDLASNGEKINGKQEEKYIRNTQYTEKLNDSSITTRLHIDRLYRHATTFFFFLLLVIVTAATLFLVWMLFAYTYYLVGDLQKLGSFLSEVWKVTTGASVVALIQLLVWSMKAKSREPGQDEK